MRLMLATIVAAILTAGVANAETRALSGFDSVSAAGRVSVEIVVGPAYSVELTGPRVDNVVTRVEGGQLRIEPDRNRRGRWSGRDAHVRITMPDLGGLDVAAGAEVDTRQVAADVFLLGVSSGASAQVAGRCGVLRLDISSGASARAQQLRCADVCAEASSGANATVYASSTISVDGSSGASLRWMGEASVRNLDLSSGASARRVN
ncbi:MAG TPA: DUF2807 domain-containing protein [Terricaulis sp.]|nr:DUF2807 domain-containing protein [Terricaulis sp.]